MKKELIMILLILALPTIMVMSMGPKPTGAVVDEIEKLRLERLKYITFPHYGTGLNGECKFQIKLIRDLIRINTDERYFDYLGLRNGPLFFANEKQVFSYLIETLYLSHVEPAKYISNTQQPIILTQSESIIDTEKINRRFCTEDIAKQASDMLNGLSDWDIRMITKTNDQNSCQDKQEAYLSLDKAKAANIAGDYDVFFIELAQAWDQATRCNAVLQS